MNFSFSERHISEYYHDGYTVFEGILPASLIEDLRCVTDRAREIAYELHGPSAQRLQPIGKFEGQIDTAAFKEYEELPVLRDAISRVLTQEHSLAGLSRMAVLFEPAELPWCTPWHRDFTANSPGIDLEEFAVLAKDATFFTQVNCALYTDVSTWYVPASDGRPDLTREIDAVAALPAMERLSYAARERANLSYCSGIPDAVQLVLEPGDFALYRPNGWHIENYSPYRKRATIHDGVWKPEVREWYRRHYSRDGEKEV